MSGSSIKVRAIIAECDLKILCMMIKDGFSQDSIKEAADKILRHYETVETLQKDMP